jgi:hypothetical protein
MSTRTAPPRSELDRVVEQVPEHLLQAVRIAEHGRIRGCRHLDAEALRRRGRPDRVDRR